MRRLLIRVGVIVLIVAVGFIFRQWLSGNVSDLNVGDCFDPPSTINTIVKDVPHHPCADPHLAEVFFVADYDLASATYPAEDEFRSFVLDRCISAFDTYTGQSFEDATELTIQPFWPTEDGWSRGDREVTCFAVRTDGGQLTGSVKRQ